MKLRYFLFVIFIFFAPLAAQGILSESSEPVQVTKFDPNDFPSEWWTFFEQKEGTSENLERVIQRLHEMQKNLPAEDRSMAETLISRFLANVSVYIQLRTENVENTVSGWLPKERYTIGEVIRLNDQVIQQSVDLNIKQEEKRELLENISSSKAVLANIIVAYREKESSSPERFMEALRWMVQRSRIAFHEEQLRLLKEKMKVKQGNLDHAKEELSLAFDRLQMSDKDRVDLSSLKAALDTTQIHLLLAETEAAKTFGGNVGEQKLEQQKAFIAQTKHLTARLDYLKGELINDLIDLRHDKVTTKKLAALLSERNDELAKAQSQADYIREKTRFDHELTSRYLANVAHDENKEDQQKILSLMQQRQKEAVETMKDLTGVDHLIQNVKMLLKYMNSQVLQGQTMVENIEYHMSEWMHLWWEKTTSIFNFVIFNFGDTPITLSGILGAIVILCISIYLSKIISSSIDRFVFAEGASAATVYTLKRIIHVVIILIGSCVALSSLGLTMSNLALIIGALSVGIGFGLQTIVNNFLCGLVLLFERNIKVGDIVELGSGLKGTVTEIHVQNTNVHTFEGMDVIVPNSQMMMQQMTNWTRKDPFQRLHIPFCVGYQTNLERVRELVSEAAKEVTSTIHDHRRLPDPDVWLINFGNSSLDLELVVWVNVFVKPSGKTSIRTEYMYMIEKVLRENDIIVPYSQLDLNIKSVPQEIFEKISKRTDESEKSPL